MGLVPGIRRRTSRPHFINMIDKNLTKAHVDYIGVAPRRELDAEVRDQSVATIHSGAHQVK